MAKFPGQPRSSHRPPLADRSERPQESAAHGRPLAQKRSSRPDCFEMGGSSSHVVVEHSVDPGLPAVATGPALATTPGDGT